ncbi:MAG TPA: DegV family protein [Thermotogota bacterium]|nr:DegV family protein [Thermotogota bacterium]
MIGLITDSASDVPLEMIKQEGIEVVPLKVILGNEEFKDAIEINEQRCLEFMQTDFAKTTGTPYSDVKEGFEHLLKKGLKQIIAINVSNNISNTHSVFQVVAAELMAADQTLSIEVIDTLSISIGSGLLMSKAVQLRQQDIPFDDIITELRKYVPQDLYVYYVIPTLKYLKAGGRIGKVSGTIGEVLNLKPIIEVGNDGVYHTAAKARGMKKSVSKMKEIFERVTQGRQIEQAAIYTSGTSDQTVQFAKELESLLMSKGVKHILEGKIVPSMLVHVGPGLVGLAFRLKYQ